MRKYKLWVSDDQANSFYVLFSRNQKDIYEKVELYEIDLLTVSLGIESFIESLKKSRIAPTNFNWNSINASIRYQWNQTEKYLPPIFMKDQLLISMLNIQNEYRYHQKQTQQMVNQMLLENESLQQPRKTKYKLMVYRDYLLEVIRKNRDFLYDENLNRELKEKINCYLQSFCYDEQVKYKNEILRKMVSYSNFRRLKAMEYNCRISDKLVEIINSQEVEEKDPDIDAFLTDEEKVIMYGEEINYAKVYQ